MNKIVLHFNSNLVGPSQKIKVGLNDTTLAEATLPVSVIELDTIIPAGPNTLWVVLCDKHPSNELRENGALVADTFVDMKNICIDGCMMNHLMNDCGFVEPDWTHHSDVASWFLENRGSVPDRLDKSKYLNFKGTYKFNFVGPIESFLEEKLAINENYKNWYNQNLSKFELLKRKILSNQK